MRDAVSERIKEHCLPDELKWSTTSKRRLKRDLSAVGCFFNIYGSSEERSAPRFQCLVADQHRLGIREFHGGDADMCFYKLLYPLLVRRIAEFAQDSEDVHVVLDQRTTKSYDLCDLREVLQHGVRKSRPRETPKVKSVEYRDSKSEPLIQVVDFLTGAVCFHQNGRDRAPSASVAKTEAASEIARLAGVAHLGIQNRYNDRFGIWTIRLKDGRAAPASR